MRLTSSAALSIDALATVNPRETAFMRYFQGTGLGAWTTLADINPLLIAAVVKAEDPSFFHHRGIEWRSVAWAVRSAVKARRLTIGASTITQQLARNLYLTPARSIQRKLREMWLAKAIDRTLSKARTLELYLNVIEWGANVWGCAAASAGHFQKLPADLDLFESTFLASVIAAPKTPLAGRNAMRCQRRQLSLAHRLFLSGLASGEACAVCCHRVWRLHYLLKEGEPLPDALVESLEIDAEDDAELLQALAIALDLQPMDPANWFQSRCGEDQQRDAYLRLRERIGDERLDQINQTHSFAPLRDALCD